MPNNNSNDLVPLESKTVQYLDYFGDYTSKRNSLFLGGKLGLLENYRHEFDQIWNRYKKLKALDWSEDEIDISPCNAEFKAHPEDITSLMIKTLAWQWEADSTATHFAVILQPFVNNTELFCYLTEHMKNEELHSLAYKFIVEHSFDNPEEVLVDILAIKQSFKRLERVETVFKQMYTLSHQYALRELDYDPANPRLIDDDYYIRRQIIKYLVTVYCLERIQFISSFAITFGLAEFMNYFVPIAKLVQKIANDEFQVHVQGVMDMLTIEFKTPDGISAFLDEREEIQAIVDEIIQSEIDWLEGTLFENCQEKAGLHLEKIKDFVYYAGTEVVAFLSLDNHHKVVTNNPLPYMNKWLVIDSFQSSPQEESVANYLLGNYQDDSKEFFEKNPTEALLKLITP